MRHFPKRWLIYRRIKVPEMNIPHLPEMEKTFLQTVANIPTNKIPEMGISLLLEILAFCMPAGKNFNQLKRTPSLPAMATKVLVDDPTEQITAFDYKTFYHHPLTLALN